jgi:hypothetical protein
MSAFDGILATCTLWPAYRCRLTRDAIDVRLTATRLRGLDPDAFQVDPR